MEIAHKAIGQSNWGQGGLKRSCGHTQRAAEVFLLNPC